MRDQIVSPEDLDPTYLGDGVYASHDGYQLWLRVEREESRVEEVALDRSVLARLVDYARKLGMAQ